MLERVSGHKPIQSEKEVHADSSHNRFRLDKLQEYKEALENDPQGRRYHGPDRVYIQNIIKFLEQPSTNQKIAEEEDRYFFEVFNQGKSRTLDHIYYVGLGRAIDQNVEKPHGVQHRHPF